MYSTADVAKRAGIHRDTLLRWLRTGLVAEPSRNRNGWRTFNDSQLAAVVAFAARSSRHPETSGIAEPRAQYGSRLAGIDWNFTDAKTSYLTHGLHPYPAKFIPQIPNALIQELSSVGETVGDIFCGSGTTLVEALTLKRNAVGVDANPLACLISQAKTSRLSEVHAAELLHLAERSKEFGESLNAAKDGDLFHDSAPFESKEWRPDGEFLSFWFDRHVVEELAECLGWCRSLATGGPQEIALTAFSAIIVGVSKQDSDTRYVRVDKNIAPGEVFRRFGRSLEQAARAAMELSELVEPRFYSKVIQASVLEQPGVPSLDLVVSSPPYPNAYSYHLYHMTRMLWLQMDQPRFKREEIGSHRKYSSPAKTAATASTFGSEVDRIMRWLATALRIGRYACFVVGDSTIKGERIDNASLISKSGAAHGFVEVSRFNRVLQSTKKAFNPVIGKIRNEKILIMQNTGTPT
jgi:DNA modification methylase